MYTIHMLNKQLQAAGVLVYVDTFVDLNKQFPFQPGQTGDKLYKLVLAWIHIN